MSQGNNKLSRRKALKYSGAAIGGGFLAGCAGQQDGGDGGGQQETTGTPQTTAKSDTSGPSSIKFTHAAGGSPDQACYDCVFPTGRYRFVEDIEAQSDGRIQVNYVDKGQLCAEGNCGQKLLNDVIEVGVNTPGNSTKFYPENNVWLRPYTFPSKASIATTFWSEEMWEEYWIPFGNKYGIVPIFSNAPGFRQIFIGEGVNIEERIRTPSGELEGSPGLTGLKIRRTFATVPATIINEWGGNPVAVGWGDTLQGMKTGVVDGLETGPLSVNGFGMAEPTDQAIVNNWGIILPAHWMRVEWIKSLDPENRQVIADVSKTISEDMARRADQITEEIVGIHESPPPEGTGFDKHDVRVNLLNDEQFARWKDPVDPVKHPELYERNTNRLRRLGAEGSYETMREVAQQGPENSEDIGELFGWWNEGILNKIEIEPE